MYMGNRLQNGVNDFKTWCEQNNHTDLLTEWDYDRNGDLLPDRVTYGSHKTVFWVCSKCGNQYKKDIHSRVQGTGCGVCSGIGKFQRRKMLFEEHPELQNELDTNINNFESVKYISAGSSQKISWKCGIGHIYEMSAANKVRSKGCPYCNNKRVLVGFNDLGTWCKANNRQAVLDDWDYTKNAYAPSDITFGSNKKAWFKCHICGYEWQTVIISRTLQRTDCKMCVRRISSSFPEQCVYHYIALYFNDAINGDRTILGGPELDVWVPSLYFAVEYDGNTWHKDSVKDISKDKLCEERKIALYRIREKGCKELDSNNSITFEYEYGDWDTLSRIIIVILKDFGIKNPDVDITRDEYLIKEHYYRQTLADSLSNLYPDISKEWHPTKNGNITPNLVSAETHDQYYWLCPNGHMYKASVKNRVRMHSGCPYCSNQKILKGFNDLETTHPEIALDYDNQKNERKSYEISRGCSDFVWFRCHKCGYEFNYQLNTYVNNGGLCPVCSKKGKTKFKKVLKYETNELFDTLPLAAKSISLNELKTKSIYKNIYNACSGKAATAYGYHWFYVTVDKNGNIIDDINSLIITDVDKHIVGQSLLMKNGQYATVIEDNYHNDIVIQFEDGTKVHTTRRSFRSCSVKNPNKTKTKEKPTKEKITLTGVSKVMKSGELAVCTEDLGSNNITIRFEDGTEVHTTRRSFNSCTVRNPNRTKIKKKPAKEKMPLIGVSKVMKSGELAVCIEDWGWNNITVRFDDGTVITHVVRSRFKNGLVSNPNAIKSVIGKTKTMKCGLACEIIDANSKTDICVKFETGEIVEHTTLTKFESGQILTSALSHNYKYRTVGERKLMNCGEYATLIADRGTHDIDIEFDDGVIVKHRDRSSFDQGTIQHPKKKTNYTGKVNVMKNGMKATVIADNGWDNIDVQFENGIVVYHKRRSHFDSGSISPR